MISVTLKSDFYWKENKVSVGPPVRNVLRGMAYRKLLTIHVLSIVGGTATASV